MSAELSSYFGARAAALLPSAPLGETADSARRTQLISGVSRIMRRPPPTEVAFTTQSAGDVSLLARADDDAPFVGTMVDARIRVPPLPLGGGGCVVDVDCSAAGASELRPAVRGRCCAGSCVCSPGYFGAHCDLELSCASTSHPNDTAWNTTGCQAEHDDAAPVSRPDGALTSVLCRCRGVYDVALHVQWYDRLMPDHALDPTTLLGSVERVPSWLRRVHGSQGLVPLPTAARLLPAARHTREPTGRA